MDAAIKARLRLHLLSERAMGLKSVPFVPVEETEEVPPLVEEARPVANTASISPAVLFEVDAPAPAKSDSGTTSVSVGGNPLSTEEKRSLLAEMDQNEVRGCTKCRLCETRTQTVFGEGDADAKIFFIGEGPGETEDQTGRPFVGRAGELLNKMIAGMGLKREQVMIANIVKCRPPNNRVPAPDEVATCTPYLERQLQIVRPSVIVTLGLPATQYMLQSKLSMGKLRGQWQAWRGVKLMPTYHPAYVLRNPTYETRAAVWSDLKKVLAEIGLPVPAKNL